MAEVEVPQTLEYRGGQLNAAHVLETSDEGKAANLDQHLKSLIMSVLPDDQMNSVINCLTAKSTWDDLILYHEGPSDVKESRVMDLKLCYNTFKFKEGESLTQTFTRYKALMNELVNDDIKLSKLEINTGFINGLPKKWLSFCQSLRNTTHMKDSKLASLFVKALMALTNEERVSVGKESARNGDWTKISMKKVRTLLEIEDNDDRKSFLDYLRIDLNYLLVLKQAKLDLLTMQHVNTEILKENQNLRLKLKEITSITETWLNSSNKVNQCINEQIPTQKNKILGINQLTVDTSSFGSKDPVFVKSSADNSIMSITSSNIHKSSKTEDSTLHNQDTDEVPSNESQRNTTNPSVVVSDSLATDYDSADESSVCSTPLLSLKKLDGAEPVSGPKTIKSILKSKSTFKAKTLKGITINEPSSAPARGKSSLASKTNSAPADLNELKLQISKKKPSYSRNKNAQQCKRTNHRTCDHAEFVSSMNANQHHTGQGESSLRSRPSRLSVSFPSCMHYGYNDHHSNDCLYYPTCEICGSYDHDTHGHNKIISLRRGINHRNPQHVTKNCETCGSNVHTTLDHNDIVWFRKRETLQAKNAESFKASKNNSSSALRSKTPTKRSLNSYPLQMEDTSAHDTIPTLFSKGGC
ncbi:hypothetical protein Tco_0488155 [Tanacetum coccineum]